MLPASRSKEEIRRSRLKAALAWGGTVAILAYMAATTNIKEAWQALLDADRTLFFGTAFISVPVVWVFDSVSVTILLHRVGFRPTFAEFLKIKGASYILNILNYNLALAMMAAFLSRSSERGIAASGSPFILLNILDLSALGLMVIAGFVAGARPFGDSAAHLTLLLVAGSAVLAGPLMCGLARLLGSNEAKQPAISRRPFSLASLLRLVQHDLLLAFRKIGLREYAWLCLLRMGFLSIYPASSYFMLRAFGINVPFSEVFVYQPILTLIIVIPISVAGLGSTQVVMRHFYAKYAPSGSWAVVDACSTTTIVIYVLLRAVIGLSCMPWATKKLQANAR